MKKVRIFLCVILVIALQPFIISAQTAKTNAEIDSLEKWVAAYPKKDTVWIGNLIKLNKLYHFSKHEKLGTLESVILDNSKKLKYEDGIHTGLEMMIYLYHQQKNFDKSLQLLLEKLSLAERTKNLGEIIDAYSILIFHYQVSKNKQMALKYSLLAQKKVLELPLNYPNRAKLRVNIEISLAVSYHELGLFDKALQSLFDTIKIIENSKSEMSSKDIEYRLAIIYQNIADTYYKLNSYKLSIIYGNKVLEYSKKISFDTNNDTYVILLNSYLKLGVYTEAEKYLKKLKDSYQLGEMDRETTLNYFDSAQEFYAQTKDFEKAYNYQKKFTTLRDSLQGKEVQEKLNDLAIKYETEKKEQQNKLLQSQNESIANANKLYLVSIITAIMLLVVIAVFYRKLESKKDTLNKLNQLKDGLFAIIAHDLKRPAIIFQNLLPVLEYVLVKKQYDKLHDVFTQAQMVSSDMNLLLDNLFKWSLSQQNKLTLNIEEVSLLPILEDMNAEFELIAKAKGITFSTNCFQSTTFIDRTVLTTVLRNILSNAFKFTNKGGKISIDVTSHNGQTEIKVIDTGIGMPATILNKIFMLDTNKRRDGTSGELGSGLGLLLIKELIELHNGKIIVKSEEHVGTEVSLLFNMKKNSKRSYL